MGRGASECWLARGDGHLGVESAALRTETADAWDGLASDTALAPQADVGQLAPLQQIHLPGMHGLQFDLLDAYRRRLGLDNPQHHEMLLAIARVTAVHFVSKSFFGLSGFLRVQ